jgi:hypothetical protein
MVRMSRSRSFHVSAVAGSTSTPSYAYTRVQKGNREPRAENTAGDFWVDHTCIGECIMHLLRHPKRRQSCRLPNAPDKCLLLSCMHVHMLSRPGHHAMHMQTKRVCNTMFAAVCSDFQCYPPAFVTIAWSLADCDTCRMMAPETYSRINEQSAVHRQPSDRQGRVRALQALLSCPT